MRPLVGFALAAVLCAVLMAVSMSGGWRHDLFRPAPPIAAPVTDPPASPPSEEAVSGVVRIPAELSPPSLGAGTPATGSAATESSTAQPAPVPAAAEDRDAAATTRKPKWNATKAARKADRDTAKARRAGTASR
ncbi:hypothetical protein [Nocardioides sp. SYSU D00065]|uniref:hypothetical protein n=1 Tax=Nocardioides sp. SYSU D00065 TaxID=2817378 RepID=UPI001B32968C|nr:hypothetical protein [Nocardioides sp. SYSU D00065]